MSIGSYESIDDNKSGVCVSYLKDRFVSSSLLGSFHYFFFSQNKNSEKTRKPISALERIEPAVLNVGLHPSPHFPQYKTGVTR